MNIQQMFEREDIYGIIEKTLVKYYKQVYKKDVNVRVKKKGLKNKFLIYPRLGMIIHVLPNREVIKLCYTSFDVKGDLWKNIVAKLYITACLCTFGLLAHRKLEISGDNLNRGTIIMPCNRKIRIYDYSIGVVDAIIKDGFSKNCFENEVYIRNTLSNDFVLKLEESGEDWYRERILPGRCLARIGGNTYLKYCNETLEDLRALAADNLKLVDAKEYLEELYTSNLRKFQEIKERKNIDCYEKIKQIIFQVYHKIIKLETKIPVALTHGDLQTGNIWVDVLNGKLYIIDWETAERRTIWYDCATLMLSTRRKGKFSYMVNHCSEEEIQKSVFINNTLDTRYDIKDIMGILILEEMKFFMDEIIDLPAIIGSEIIKRFEFEMDNINWSVFLNDTK